MRRPSRAKSALCSEVATFRLLDPSKISYTERTRQPGKENPKERVVLSYCIFGTGQSDKHRYSYLCRNPYANSGTAVGV
jgi:hypothetical protein